MQTSRNHAKKQIKPISFDFGRFRWGISPILLKTLRPPPRLPHPEQRASNGAHPHRPRSPPRSTFPLPPPQQRHVFPKGGKRPSRPANAAHPMPHTHLDDDHASPDRKSTRLNSSHVSTSYAVFCLKKKQNT